MFIAANYTRVATSQTNALIAAGGSITVYGIIIQAVGSAATATINESDGATAIMTLSVASAVQPSPRFRVIKTNFKANRGLAVTTDSLATVTVFHSNAD